MDVTFIYMMFGLKIPIVALLAIVWWAIRAVPEPAEAADGGGGTKRPPHPRPQPPRRPRRGPHADPPVPAPERTRAAPARSRQPLDRT